MGAGAQPCKFGLLGGGRPVNNIRLLEELCAVIDMQNSIIKKLAYKLALTENEREEIAKANKAVKDLLGDTHE